jgi:hypothetical protein
MATSYELKGSIMIWKPDTTSTTAKKAMEDYEDGTYFFGKGSTKKWTRIEAGGDTIEEINKAMTYGTTKITDVTNAGEEEAIHKALNKEWNDAFKEDNPIPKIIEIIKKHDKEFSFRSTLINLKAEEAASKTSVNISGIHALKLCDLFKVTYEKEPYRLKHVGWEELTSVVTPDLLSATILPAPNSLAVSTTSNAAKYVDLIFIYATLAEFINWCIDKLNDAVDSRALSQIRFGLMSTDGSLKSDKATFTGGSMVGGSGPESMELVKKAILGYSVDFKNYMFGGIPAHFDMSYSSVGGTHATSVNKVDPIDKNRYVANTTKRISEPNANRSSDFFAKAFQEIQQGAKNKKIELGDDLVKKINDAIEELRKQEETLLDAFDKGVVGTVANRVNGDKEITTDNVNADDEKAYKALFSTVDSIARKESRLYTALVALLGRVAPGYYLPSFVGTPIVSKSIFP